jgi:hypothetical protein
MEKKNPSHKRAGRVAQTVEFKPQCHQKKKKKKKKILLG